MKTVSDTAGPILLLPGLLETHHIWDHVIDRLHLTPDRTDALDLPGHIPGQDAATVTRVLTSGAWLEQVANRLRDRFGGQPVTIIGHSTGGMIALQLARRYPALVESLVLIGALTKGDRERGFDPGARLVETPLLGSMAFRAGVNMWLSTPERFQQGYVIGAAQHRVRVPAPEAMRLQLRACDPSALHATAMWVLHADIERDLPQVTCPILAIIGTKDPVVPPLHQIGIIRKAPMACARLVPAGHLPFAECPDQVINALRGWRLRSAVRDHGNADTDADPT